MDKGDVKIQLEENNRTTTVPDVNKVEDLSLISFQKLQGLERATDCIMKAAVALRDYTLAKLSVSLPP